MLRWYVLLLLYFNFISARAQELSGYQLIHEVAEIIEKDYPGYRILTRKQKKEYLAWKCQILNESRLANPFEISILINEYLRFFNDGHLNSIYLNNNYPDSLQINIYPQKRYIETDIRGLWHIKNYDIVVSLMKERNVYFGYIYKDLNEFSNPGDRYLVIFPALGKNQYNLLLLVSDGVAFSKTVTYKNGRFYENVNKVFMERIEQGKVRMLRRIYNPDRKPTIRQINSETIEMRIPSLSAEDKPIIDSLLTEHDERIRNAKTLIIDLRGNPGGGILPTLGLIKYINTGQIHYINSFSLATDSLIENVKRNCLYGGEITDTFFLNYCNKYLPNLMANRGLLIFDSSEVYNNPGPLLPRPINVAIVTDNSTSSAAELFVLAAKQSKKVTVFGENSAGAVDFGGEITYYLSNRKYVLYLTSEMAEYIKEKRFDGVGIDPDVRLFTTQERWIEEITQYYAPKKTTQKRH